MYHIVRRIVSSTPSLLVGNGGNRASLQSRRNSASAVTDLVLERHREYRRKDPGWVRSCVEGAILSLGSCSGSGSGSGGQGGGGGSPGKRRAPASVPIGGGSDPRHDVADPPSKRRRTPEPDPPDFRPADSSGELPGRQLERSGSSGMLNAGLRSRYRDVAAREAREASDHDPAASEAADGEGDKMDDGDAGKTAGGGNLGGRSEQAASKPPAGANTPGVTPKKKKRTKKTPSSKAPSSSSDYPSDPLSSGPASIQPTARPVERYADLGGMSDLLNQVRELVEYREFVLSINARISFAHAAAQTPPFPH